MGAYKGTSDQLAEGGKMTGWTSPDFYLSATRKFHARGRHREPKSHIPQPEGVEPYWAVSCIFYMSCRPSLCNFWRGRE